MDLFSLLLFRLDSYIMRIKELYSYIFRFFLPDGPYYDDEDGIFESKRPNRISI